MTTDAHTQHESRFAERYGYRPSRAASCPRVVAGKRCHADRVLTGQMCICLRHDRIFDHTRIWLDENGHHVLTAEPYGLDLRHFVELAADLDTLGLEATISGASPWNPGYTTLVAIHRPSHPLPLENEAGAW